MPDELRRWAAERAPDLVARAEAEAIEELKRALLEAATERAASAEPRAVEPTVMEASSSTAPAPRRSGRRAPIRPERTSRKPPPTGDALWTYCVLRAPGQVPDPPPGVHPDGRVRPIEHDDLVALVSRVPLAEFGADALHRNLNDLAWLERVARAHEAVLDAALAAATIVPLPMCTIWESEEGVRRMLVSERAELEEALDRLDGRQEWGVKLLVDPAALRKAAHARSDEAPALEAELEARGGGGGGYMVRRRLERHLREVAGALAKELADDIHARLQDWATDAVTSPPQNRELSGHEGEMLLNGAYLVETDRVEQLRELVDKLADRHRNLGARLELTGPWPPYNFVQRSGSVVP
jgi:hypothetical protein